MKKFLVFIVMAVLIFIIVTYMLLQQKYYRDTNGGELIITNKAGQEIINGTVEVSRQKFAFKNIKPNESRVFSFNASSESGYAILIEFASGQKLAKEIGYVTSGFIFKDSLIIKNDDIILGSHSVIK